jgi:hypothetical protein
MKIKSIIVPICLIFLLASARCSREKSVPPPAKKITTVKIAKRSEQEKLVSQEKIKDKKTEVNAKAAEDISKVTLQEKTPVKTKTYAGSKESITEEMPGYYAVKKGECLSDIASKENVYKDSLKWPILYRLNLKKLQTLQLEQIPQDRELPEGMLLKTISSSPMAKESKTKSEKVWAVNVLSTTTTGKIPPVAIKLIENGYLVYIKRFKLKDKEWMRLRVGFFDNKAQAEKEGKKIMAMLNLHDSWVTKTGKQEIAEFGSYL